MCQSNVHFPTDYNLLWDSARKCLDDFSTILYLRNSGEVPVTIYKTGEDANYTVIVNKAGSNTVTKSKGGKCFVWSEFSLSGK